jgi:peptidoglycan/xylan/chitin deacetylase (PgdA/CDA1 family)
MTGHPHTTYRTVSGQEKRPPTSRCTWLHVAVLSLTAVILGGLAFFLTPTGHANLRNVVQLNGVVRSVQTGITAFHLTEPLMLQARNGSVLDLTGDVLTLAGGSPAVRTVNGGPLKAAGALADGATLIVRHGDPRLEQIQPATQEMPFATTTSGQGNIVSLAQTGSLGERDVYTGVSSGREAVAVVTVAPLDTVYRLDSTPQPGQKLAALTFDDGPGTHTQEVLAALAAAHVPATFFVQGSSASAYPKVIQQEKDAGHEVENHTWNHPWLTKVSAEEFASQITRTNNAIGGARFLRPPYGDVNATVRALASSMGLRVVLWSVDTRDWERQDVDAIMSHVKAETRPGAIILMHDGGPNRLQTVAAIPVVVDWLFAHGYSLTTVDQIL